MNAVPKILLTALLTSIAASQEEAAVPPVIHVGGDAHKAYILHSPPGETRPPKAGWKLLVVMPGGDGSADFAPFVGRIRANTLDEQWLVAQLIAPVWDAEQAQQLVWPTRRSPWPGMEFTCETLFHDVVADIAREHELDPKYLFTLAWSSSGMLAYTLGLEKESPITGTFIAMSVYKPDLLPSRKAAKGRRFFILHSPGDFIPIAMAEKARDDLQKAKAEVRFATYEGGHGWHGDVHGNLRGGLEWLESQARKARAPKRSR